MQSVLQKSSREVTNTCVTVARQSFSSCPWGCILSPCLLYAEHIMRKVGLDESQVGIMIAGRNINNLSYAEDTTLMAESEEELKSLLMRVKEESAKVGLKLNIKKTKIMASGPITSWQINGEEMKVVTDFIFLGSKITADGGCNQEIKRRLLLRKKAMANLDSILKSRDITLPTKVPIVKAMVFPVAVYGCESCTIRKAERQRIDAFELWCWRRLLRVPWTARRSNQSEEIDPDCSLEDQILLKMKLKYFGHLMRRKDLLENSLMLGTIDGKGRRGRQRMRQKEKARLTAEDNHARESGRQKKRSKYEMNPFQKGNHNLDFTRAEQGSEGQDNLAGIPSRDHHKMIVLKTVRTLQLVQNRAARLLTGTGRYAHMTPVLHQLHWLPIEARAQFKVLIMTYKALNGLGPGYLHERLRPYMPDRPLRSAGESLLREPSMKEIRRVSTRRRAFSAVAPNLWNSLPKEVRLAPSLLVFRRQTINLASHWLRTVNASSGLDGKERGDLDSGNGGADHLSRGQHYGKQQCYSTDFPAALRTPLRHKQEVLNRSGWAGLAWPQKQNEQTLTCLCATVEKKQQLREGDEGKDNTYIKAEIGILDRPIADAFWAVNKNGCIDSLSSRCINSTLQTRVTIASLERDKEVR
ncbi:putative uncharacterized transposon-derived protein F52C9.6 [Varanus komodoensis]|nr:putative uncharacterized transposon-derived protein F52C9.6 [Varanus komodoensis]